MAKFNYMDWQKAQPRWVRDFLNEKPEDRAARLSQLEVPGVIEALPAASPAKP